MHQLAARCAGSDVGRPSRIRRGRPIEHKCEEWLDLVLHLPDGSVCDDGQLCNGLEVCSAAFGCSEGQPPTNDDGLPCTVESCDEQLKAITNEPVNEVCSDGVYCNGQEICSPLVGCVTPMPAMPAMPAGFDDGMPCTLDGCDELTQTVAHQPSHAVCDDALFCNGLETCDPDAGCVAGVPPVVLDAPDYIAAARDEVADAVVYPMNDADCDDGIFCTGFETCTWEGCVTAELPIDDGFFCTLDACMEGQDVIVHTPIHQLCDDGLFCTGMEVCAPTLPGTLDTGCLSIEQPCNDGIACTTDASHETQNTCVHSLVEGCQGGAYPAADDHNRLAV
ncbi:MAG: hypothetical protein ACI9EF_004005 [Pseudohongiellaceae bacterium]